MTDIDPTETAEPKETPPADPLAAVKELAESIKAGIAEARNAPVQPAAPPAAPVEDPRTVIEREAKEFQKEFDSLMAEGNYAEAMVKRDMFMQRANTLAAGKAEDSPYYKTAIQAAERLAKNDHKDMFAKYGAEIKAWIATRPLEERIQPSTWDSAVEAVRTKHFDEILAAEVAKKEEELKGKFIQPGTGAPRGRTGSDKLGLDATEIEVANALGIPAEKYAEAKKLGTGFMEGVGTEIPVLPNTRIQPGKF